MRQQACRPFVDVWADQLPIDHVWTRIASLVVPSGFDYQVIRVAALFVVAEVGYFQYTTAVLQLIRKPVVENIRPHMHKVVAFYSWIAILSMQLHLAVP